MQILTHSMKAGGMSKLVLPQECIFTTKAASADNAVVKCHGLRPPLPYDVKVSTRTLDKPPNYMVMLFINEI